MLIQRRTLALAGLWLLLSFSAFQAQAQTVSCTGVPAWNASTIYNPGDRMVYQGSLYQANIPIWNAPPNHCPSCGWYTLLGTCGTGGDTTPPSVPTGLHSPSQASTTIALSWSASTDNPGGSGVAGYDVYRNGSLVASPTATSHTDSGLTPSTTYSYTVRARDNAGNASAQSAAVSATTTTSTDTTPPSVPTGLQSPSQAATSIALSWSASTDNPGGSGVAGYDVYRNGSLVASPTATSHTDSGLTPNTTYSYTVRARDNAGNASAQSPAVSATTTGTSGGGKHLVGYFAQWGIYQRAYYVKNIETSGSAAKLTAVNYAFGNVVNNRCSVGITQLGVGDAWADYQKSFDAGTSVDGVGDTWNQPLKGNWNQLKKLKARHPGLKVIISLGGWTWSDGFYSAARPENRAAFVASCIDAYIRGNLPFDAGSNSGGAGAAAGVFDGIDIDWEYPAVCGNNPSCGASAADTQNLTGLLQEFRSQLDAVNPNLLLTAAVAAGEDKVAKYDIAGVSQSLDFINIMTYDFFGAWSSTGPTAFHSPLYAWTGMPQSPPLNHYYGDFAVRLWKQGGAPASKLNLGIGFYGRGWTGVTNANQGLNQAASGPAPGTYEAGIEDTKVLKNLGYPAYTSSQAGTAWIFNGSTFWSFDTPATIATKMGYVMAQGLGGAFAWELDGDDASGSLLAAMKNGLQSSDTTPPSEPAGLHSTAQTATTIALAWSASTDSGGSGIAGYDLYRNGSLVASPTATSHTDSGLTPNTTYSYRVRARDNAGNASAQSAAVSVTTASAACNTLPSVPTGLASPSQTSSSVSLTWGASSPGTNCTVQYRIFQGGTQVAQVATTSTSIGGLAANTTYSFTVAAINEFGSSGQTSPLSVTTQGTTNTCTAAAWNGTAVYTSGMQAVHRNYLWEAKWWNQNSPPAASDSAPWKIIGYCGALPGPAAGRVLAPYVDVTMGFNLTANAPKTGGVYTLAFIVDGGGCTASWAGSIPLSSNHYVSDIATLRAAGGDVVVSFGGAAGSELGSVCPSVAALQAQYQAVVTKYQLRRVDFDLEGGGLSNYQMRNQAIKNLQAANPGLAVSYTLPVLPTGLLPNAVAVISDAIDKGVDISQVNIMAMDFGSSYDNGGQMELSAVRSAWATMSQLEVLWPGLSHAQVAKKVGVTVMIGQNDTFSEVFKLTDVGPMVADAKNQGVGLLSFWSATRDQACPGGQTGPPALGTCSGVTQSPFDFSVGFKAFKQ